MSDESFAEAVPHDDAVAVRLLAKLRAFVGTLDEAERTVLAALLAPGVAGAYRDPIDDDPHAPDVVGFGMSVDGPDGPDDRDPSGRPVLRAHDGGARPGADDRPTDDLEATDDDVEPDGSVRWQPSQLPDSLARQIRDRRFRIEME